MPAVFDAPVAESPAGLRHHGFLVPETRRGSPPAAFPGDGELEPAVSE